MLQPCQTSPEEGPSTDVDPGGPRPGTSTIAETDMRVQRVESASQLQCGSEEKLLQFFDGLSQEEWSTFSLEMQNSTSRAEFIKICTDIARVVHLTSMNIVIPALYQMVDQQSQESKSQTASRPSSSGSSRSSHRSVSFIEDDVDVMIMRNGVLSQIIQKRRRSRASVRSSRSSLSVPKEQQSPFHGSQTSLVDSKSATLCNEPKTSFALTKESVCLSVIQSLGMTLIDLQSQSLDPDLKDFSTRVVEEVAVSVLRALKTSGQRDVTAQETKDMLQRVSQELSVPLAKKDVEKALVSPAEDETHKHLLASTAAKAMDVVVQTMEDCLDDVKKSKPAKNILAAIRKVIRVLAYQSTSLEELKDDALTDLNEEDADVTLPIKTVISTENFERNATAKVSQILLKSTGSFHAAVESDDSELRQDSLQTTTLPALPVASNDYELAQGSMQTTATSAQSTASDILKTAVRGIEKLLQLRSSENEDVSILQTNKRAESTVSNSRSPQNNRVTEIFCTARNTFQMLESRLKDFYNLKMSSCVRNNQRAYADAKKVVSKVLVTLQKEIPNLADFEHSDDLRLMWTIVSSMIDNIEEMEEEYERERSGSSVEAQRSKTPSSLSSTAGPGCFSMCPIVRHTYIDMSDTGSDHEPTACITQETVINVAKIILTKLGLVKDISASSISRDDLSTVSKSVEKVLSSGSICQHSPGLTSEVYYLLLEGNKSPEAIALCAGKSVSDSILLKVGRSERACRKDSTFQLIKAYSLESVKYLLLPLFHFSSPQGASQDKVLGASASRSCPTVLQSITGEMMCQRASRSPSEILDATVTLVSNIIVSDIMEATSLSAEMLVNDIRHPSLDVDRVSLSSSSGIVVPDQPGEGQDKVTVSSMPLPPMKSNNEDQTGFVTLLVIRLLSQVQGQRDLSDDTLDMSRRLMDKVLNGFDAAPGNSQSDTCAQVNIHKVYRAIYSALVKEFGSENLVSKAMESNDPCFEEAVIASLRNELLQTRTSVEAIVVPAPTEDVMEENRKQPRRGILRFLPKMPKINLKKFKIKKRNQVSSKGETAITVSSNTVSAVSSEEKPRRRNLFIRMMHALTKKSASS